MCESETGERCTEDDPGWLALYKALLGADINIVRRLQLPKMDRLPDSPVGATGQPSAKGRKLA